MENKLPGFTAQESLSWQNDRRQRQLSDLHQDSGLIEPARRFTCRRLGCVSYLSRMCDLLGGGMAIESDGSISCYVYD